MRTQVAALVNGITSHVDDYDDKHLETIIHPANVVASALLVVAQAAVSAEAEWQQAHGQGLPVAVFGQDFLTAFAAGVEA